MVNPALSPADVAGAAGSTPDERWMNAAAQADAPTIPGRGELSEIYNKASQTRFKSCNRIAPKAS
jgi:hypothetical protein